MTLTLKILVTALLVILGNILTLMEISVVSVNSSELSAVKGKKAERIEKLRTDTKSYLGSLRAAMTMTDIATGACAAVFFQIT